MPPVQFSTTDLRQLHRQLVAWRRSRPKRLAIPAQVWEAATALARIHGAGRVGRTLHLDFYKLRERLQQPCAEATPPTFVEVRWPGLTPVVATSSPCTVELSDEGGAHLRMHLPSDAPILVTLAEAFWRRPR